MSENIVKKPLDVVLNATDIMNLIPHRYPFLLIDRVQDIVPYESAVGIKMVTMNEWFFQGHFPNHPIMPGVLIIEAMAQTAGVLVVQSLKMDNEKHLKNEDNMVYFMSIEQAKFRKPVTPGDCLELRVVKNRQRGNVWKFTGQAFVDGKVVDEAMFTAMIAK